MPATPSPTPATTDSGRPPPSRGAATVLVVDDDPGVRAVTRAMLDRLGYTVRVAADAAGAVAAAREGRPGVDLLLADVVMPGTGGPALAARLRREVPGLRVLFMSAYTRDEAFDRRVADRAVAFIQKPFTAEGLGRAVLAALGRPTGS